LRIASAAGTLVADLLTPLAGHTHIRARHPQNKKLLKPILWIWALLLLIAITAAFYQGWKRLNIPHELDYGEGALMWQVQNVFDRNRAYAPLDGGPLVIWNYPPAYLMVVHGLWRVQGDLLWSGRYISFLSGFGLVLLLAGIIYRSLPRRLGKSIRLCAAGSGLLFLCTAPAANWFPFMRVDWLGLLATYLGVFFFLSAESKHWKSYLAFLFFLLAICTKQTFLAAPLACFLVVLVTAPRRALRLGLFCVVLGGIAFWLGMRWTNGGFADHLILYNVHKFSFTRALGGISWSVSDSSLFLVSLGALILLAISRIRRMAPGRAWKSWKARLQRSPSSLALSVELLHWTFAFLFSFAYGKVGTSINHFLESDAALCALSGLSLGVLFWQTKRAPRLTTALAVALMIPVALAGNSLDTILNSLVESSENRAANRDRTEAYRQLIPLIAGTYGPVLSDDMVLLTRAGKDLLFEPATMGFVADAGNWNPSRFERRLASKEFAVILIVRPKAWQPRLLLAIQSAYQLDRVVGRFQVYRPRQP
jgi:hypothetical protein